MTINGFLWENLKVFGIWSSHSDKYRVSRTLLVDVRLLSYSDAICQWPNSMYPNQNICASVLASARFDLEVVTNRL